MTTRFLAALVAAGLAMATGAHAAITYTVDRTVGLGSVAGTITTDGTIGTLAVANVTAYSLTLSAPGAAIVLTNLDSGIFQSGANFSATATQLLFDYDGPAGFLDFQTNFSSGARYYCNASDANTCRQGESVVPETYLDASAQFVARTGKQVIATVAGVPDPAGGVPEPASWALMVAGFGVVGAAARRRRTPVPA